MRKVRMGALVAVAAVGLSATFVSQAGAFPSRTSPCAGCHDGANIPITATATSNNGANATYSLSAPGADYIAVFNGSTKVTQITGSSGSITVATGNTYTLNSVAGPSTSDGLGTLSISPAGAPADTTAPVTTSNAAASYVSMAAIALSATDAGSGVAATYYKLDGGAQVAGTAVVTSAIGSHTLQFWSVDKAGNTEAAKTANFTVTAPVPVDATAPVTTSNAVASYVSNASIALTATDGGSGVAATYYKLDGGAQVAGTAVVTSAIGSHTLQFWSVDKAGNTEAAKTANFTVTAPVPVDATAPVTTSNAVASYVSNASIALTATDGGSGVAATYYKLDGGAQVAGTAVVTSAIGSHTLQFWSVDKAGNTEAAKTANFTVTAPVPVDATAPVTTSNAVASYVSNASIALTATDGGSGVAATYYKLDGGAQVAGTAVVTSALGSHTLQFWSVDKAGNTEAAKTVNFTVTAPVPEPPSSGLTSSTVSIKSSNWRISRYRSATLSGELTPASGGEVVALYVMKPGSNEWQLLSTRNTNLLNDRDDDEYDDDDDEREYSINAVTESAEASWSYRFWSRTRGTYQFQVRFAGDADSTGAVSRTVSISVR